MNTVWSILNSPIQNICVLVTDNCSADDTLTRLGEIKDSRLIIHRNKENYGQVGGWAQSLRVGAETGAKYLMLIIDRMVLVTHRLPKLMELLEKDDLSLVICQSSVDAPNIIKKKGMEAFLEVSYDWKGPSNVIYRTEYIKNIVNAIDVDKVFDKYLIFPNDIWDAEMALKGDICIFGLKCVEAQTDYGKKSSVRKIDGNAWFTTSAGIRQFEVFIRHLAALPLTADEKEAAFFKTWGGLVNHLMQYPRRVGIRASAEYYDTEQMKITYYQMMCEARKIRAASFKAATDNKIILKSRTKLKIALAPLYVIRRFTPFSESCTQ